MYTLLSKLNNFKKQPRRDGSFHDKKQERCGRSKRPRHGSAKNINQFRKVPPPPPPDRRPNMKERISMLQMAYSQHSGYVPHAKEGSYQILPPSLFWNSNRPLVTKLDMDGVGKECPRTPPNGSSLCYMFRRLSFGKRNPAFPDKPKTQELNQRELDHLMIGKDW